MNSQEVQSLEASQTKHAACEKKTNHRLAELNALIQKVADPELRTRFAHEQLLIYEALMEERAATSTLSLDRGNLTAANAVMAVKKLQRQIRELSGVTAG
ncbi:MAG: hypothetical protein PHX93_04370 [Candidatus Peribacteraceae bacterium]|nr:hypothetical protein [Candidatus Peribacteraceae bacterium]